MSDKNYTKVLWKKLMGESNSPSAWISQGRPSMRDSEDANPTHHPDFSPIMLLSDDENLDSVQVNAGTTIDKSDHDRLLLHCRTLLDQFRTVARYRHLRRMRHAWANFQAVAAEGLSHDEAAQLRANSPTTTLDHYLTLPFVYQKVKDLASIIGGIVFPPTGMYAAISTKNQLKFARSFSTEMNRHAVRFGHYPEAMSALENMIRYNIAGLHVSWDKVYGQVGQKKSPEGGVQFKRGVVYEGNRLTSIDPFNLYYDTTVSKLNELGLNGEFVAYAARDSLFRVRARIKAGEYFGSTELGDDSYDGTVIASDYMGYYYLAPNYILEHWEKNNHEQQNGPPETHYNEIDWNEMASHSMSGGTSSVNGLSNRGLVELVHMYVRLDADDYGLMPEEPETESGGETEEGITVWHIVILNGKRIILAEPDQSPHGLLPIQVASLESDDNSDMNEKSIADYLRPFQEHITDIIAKVQMSLKKGLLGGITVYDSKHVRLDTLKNPLGSYVPIENLPNDSDIRRHITQFSETPDTAHSLDHVTQLMRMMEQVIPTNQGQQVADLQRATEFQAAATIAASNKRSLVLAKIADDTMFNPVRRMQLLNIMQNMQTIDIPDENGEMQPVGTDVFLSAGLEFDISSGLIGIDRLIMSNRLWQVITAVIQSNLAQTTDMFALIDYYITLLGDPTDFRSFKLQSPFDNMTPEQKAMAVQALQIASNGQQGNAPAIAQPSTPPLKP